MKKAFGMLVLAGLPVACGTTLPSTPAVIETTPASEGGTVSSQGSSITDPCVVNAPAETQARIEVVQVGSGPGWVRVRAKGLRSASGDTASRCSGPTWSAAPLDGVIKLAEDGWSAMLLAAPGRYEVTVRVAPRTGSGSYGRLSVEVR